MRARAVVIQGGVASECVRMSTPSCFYFYFCLYRYYKPDIFIMHTSESSRVQNHTVGLRFSLDPPSSADDAPFGTKVAARSRRDKGSACISSSAISVLVGDSEAKSDLLASSLLNSGGRKPHTSTSAHSKSSVCASAGLTHDMM